MSAMNVNCAPVADILCPQTDNIIGDRAYGDNVYDVLVNNAEIMVKPEQARNVIKIIELAFLSSSENKRAIKLL